MGVNFLRINIKICFFQKVEKSQNKVGVTEEIGCLQKCFEHDWPKECELVSALWKRALFIYLFNKQKIVVSPKQV